MKNAKLIAILVLVVLLGTIIVQNRGPVETHLLVVTVTMPQILLLALTAAGGFVIGVLAAMTGRTKPTKPA
ncbi:MAG: LapA family protein [Phycisphaerae bacterium]|nr:LapA family protein [Phycisphaerae bacterium]